MFSLLCPCREPGLHLIHIPQHHEHIEQELVKAFDSTSYCLCYWVTQPNRSSVR